MENSIDMTSVVNTFTGNGHYLISLGLVILTIVVIPMFKGWLKRESDMQKELAEARKKERDGEQEAQNREIEALKADTKEARQKLDDYVTKVEFSDYKDKIRGMEREITEIHRTCFTKTDAREIFTKIDSIRESLDRFKDTIFASRGDKQ